MILKGSQRAGAKQLASHLLNRRDNDQVTVLELRGFVADDLSGALHEAYAVSKATRCEQFLFSLSLNPPKDAPVGEEAFKRAADEAEKALGLEGQPRAIVLHEKEGRRHAHVVWSRIDPDEMKAINLSHFKRKLTTLSRELYLENEWSLPEGLKTHGGKSPLNFTLAEWQQTRRLDLDPREIKAVFREAWDQSDGPKAFAAALEAQGFHLARGDRRGVVALDVEGNVYAVGKYLGERTSSLRARLGSEDDLPSIAVVKAGLQDEVSDRFRALLSEMRTEQVAARAPLIARRDELRTEHRAQQAQLREAQALRWQAETEARTARLRTGIAGLWDKLSGKAAAIRDRNAVEAFEGLRRDQRERDQLVIDQLGERRAVQQRIEKLRRQQLVKRQSLRTQSRAIREALARDQDGGHSPRPDRSPRKRGFSLDL